MLRLSYPRAVVVAQSIEWLLPKPEVRSLNPDIGKTFSKINYRLIFDE